MIGNPKVMLIASYSNSVFIGVSTWSWYIPKMISKFFLLFFKKIVSAAKGPEIFIPLVERYLMAGFKIFKSLAVINQNVSNINNSNLFFKNLFGELGIFLIEKDNEN